MAELTDEERAAQDAADEVKKAQQTAARAEEDLAKKHADNAERQRDQMNS